MKKKLSFLFVLTLLSNLFAQVIIFPHIHLRVDDADESSISITGLDIKAKVTANVAVTTYDIVFYNDSSRDLEGEFEFPLKQGQSVCGFALDINGKLRDGVIVEKEKGRQVFEDVVRKQVDPALLEITAGNNYKARVYPIPAKGSRHIQIKIQETLSEPKYVLDPLTDKKIRRFSFTLVDYRNAATNTAITSSDIPLSTGLSANFSANDYEWKKSFSVNLLPSDSKTEVFIETKGTESYFYAPLSFTTGLIQKAKVSKLGVFFDTSLSRKSCSLDKEIALLKAYLEKQDSGELQIVTFNNEVRQAKFFKFNQWEDIEAYIRSLKFDGATKLNSSDFKTGVKKPLKYDEILIFSDGLINWGKEQNFGFDCPVTTISSSFSADYNSLTKIARCNNGDFINLCNVEVSSALNQLLNEPLRLISVKAADGLKEVYPVNGTVVSSDFSVAGILTKKSAVLKLGFGHGNKIEFEKSITVDAVNGFEAENVARLWAQKKIDELSLDYNSNKNEILKVSREFTIVTEGTSLIVLENLSDYHRYNIEPPEDLLKEYKKLFGSNSKSVEPHGIPSSVYSNFEKYKKWWNTNPKDFKKQVNKPNNPLRHNSAAEATLYEAESPDVYSDMMNVAGTENMMLLSEARSVAAEEEVTLSNNGQVLRKSASESSTNTNAPRQGEIKIQAWNPNASYLKTLKKTKTEEMYAVYFTLREDFISSPSFYMEVADYFFREGLKDEAICILSNLSELNLENTDMLRAMGNKLVEFGYYELAAETFEKLIVMRSEVPQFLRDAALAYEKLDQPQKACDLLYEVVCGNWDSRYSEIQQTCLNDMNAIIAANSDKVDTSNYDKKLLQNFPVDIRVVLTWNTDDCDIDLWVTDPHGEKCYYGHKLTQIGGRISRDFTQGYGPEEFALKKADSGKYLIQAHYYGSHSQKVLQPVIVQAEVYTNFGKPDQEKEILTLELANVDGNYTIGEITF